MSAEPTLNGELRQAPVPVAGPVRAVEPRFAGLPAVPVPRGAAAVAAGGVAGIVAFSAIRVLRRRRRTRLGRRRPKEAQRSILGTRSFLVDVHVLGR